MARTDLDPLLLDPTRLSIVSLLTGVEWAEFSWVRESVGLSASALSKQVTTLGDRGYVEVDKGYVGKRPRTWLNLSAEGHQALQSHLAALQSIVDESRRTAEAYQPEPTNTARPGCRRPGQFGRTKGEPA